LNKIVDTLYYNLWTIFCVYLILCLGLLALSFLTEIVRWGTTTTFTYTIWQHWFWDYFALNLLITTAGYLTIIITFTVLNCRRRKPFKP
jgi:hypothetical protein